MENLLLIINIVVGILSLAGVLYIIGYWKGGIDAWKKAHEEEHSRYALSEMFLMCKTMWDIVVVDALHRRPDLADHSSPYKLKKLAEDLIPEDLKQKLGEIASNHTNAEDIASGWMVVKNIGMPSIEQMAKDKQLSVPEAIAILSTYLDQAVN